MKKLGILVADDHAIVREGLQLLINAQSDLQVIAAAGDGLEVLRLTEQLKPDIILMDLSMPKVNGLQATERLKAAHKGTKVIAITAHEDADYMRQMIRAGVDGYVIKRAAGQQLIQAIHTVAQGGVHFDATVTAKVFTDGRLLRAETGSHSSSDLSAQERKVVVLLAWGHSHKEAAAKLRLSIKTVETYIARVNGKLGFRNRAEMVRYAVRQGWMYEALPEA